MIIRCPTPLKEVLQLGNAWYHYWQKYIDTIRPAVVENILKILLCGLLIKGFREYECLNEHCHHSKKSPFSCTGRYCPTCGKRATDIWIEKQKAILPQCRWQHITFTMPDVLWPYFDRNRYLLNGLAKIAADTVMEVAEKKGLKIGVFTALHTFGRDLKWNVHVHLSVTMGGLTADEKQWKDIRFSEKVIMPKWREKIIEMFREEAKADNFYISNRTLDIEYNKYWRVHFGEPTGDAWHTISYLGRYVKRPPLSMSRLEHYDGKTVAFNYLNHKNKQHEKIQFSSEDFIDRFVKHIPDKYFKVIRYYGFLANAVRGKLLPKVYDLVGHEERPSFNIRWADQLKRAFGVDPLKCILCGAKMGLVAINYGKSNRELKKYHKELATRQMIPA